MHCVALCSCTSSGTLNLPYPAFPNPVTSLHGALFWCHCHGERGDHVHRKAYAWSRVRCRMLMHNVHVCMYVSMYMYVHVHVCASPCILTGYGCTGAELWVYPRYARFTLADPMPRLCPDAVGSANVNGLPTRNRPSGPHREAIGRSSGNIKHV